MRPVQPNPDSRPPQPPHRSHSRVPTERSFRLSRRGAAARLRPGHPHSHGSHHITQDRMEDRTSPTQGTVDALPAAPGQRRRDHAGQDERDPDQLPGPDDALCWKDPFGGHAGGHQGQPSAKPSQMRPLVGEFGLDIGPAPFTPPPRSSQDLVVSGATDLPLLGRQYLLMSDVPDDGTWRSCNADQRGFSAGQLAGWLDPSEMRAPPGLMVLGANLAYRRWRARSVPRHGCVDQSRRAHGVPGHRDGSK